MNEEGEKLEKQLSQTEHKKGQSGALKLYMISREEPIIKVYFMSEAVFKT